MDLFEDSAELVKVFTGGRNPATGIAKGCSLGKEGAGSEQGWGRRASTREALRRGHTQEILCAEQKKEGKKNASLFSGHLPS